MPSAAARRIYEDQIPSFMTVFDLDAETMADQDTVTLVNPKMVDMESKAAVLSRPSRDAEIPSACLTSDHTHPHRDSTSTQTSESAESSPTTTLSTTDSSPSSSPDSPLNLIPLNNYPLTSFSSRPPPPDLPALATTPFTATIERPMTSPAPRRRNMKGLSIQPPGVANAMSKSTVLEPSSPSFIKPTISGMKRKPSLLSIKTNTTDMINQTSLEIPASPALPPILQRRALKHSTSSPHMISCIKTATFGPSGGMTFPKMLERNESGLSEVLRPMKTSMNATFDRSIFDEESPIKTQLAKRADYEPYRENENNEDQKTTGYPDGPIAIYGDNVYLYLEPSAKEASRFDVVINVAREVKNPFAVDDQAPPSRSQSDAPIESPTPDTAVSVASFATAWEYQPSDDKAETPTTPKPNLLHKPEYIHMPWDHNTDIAPDLMNLCEIISARTKDGKKVLVHCQQGASRSASLIIAYGLYQNPDLSVNDAYYAAQTKSRWISPNMKLMYSLQDFHKELSQRRTSQNGGSFGTRVGRSPSSKHKLTLSTDETEIQNKEPKTAPLPVETNGSPEEVGRVDSITRLKENPVALQTISPGPASAPLSFSWRDNLGKPEPAKEMPKEAPPSLPERKEPVVQAVEVKPEAPRRIELPSSFKLHAPPQRPKSAHSTAKPRLPPAVQPFLRPLPSIETRSFSCSMGFKNTLSPLEELSPLVEQTPVERTVPIPTVFPQNEALLSPRAEEMTSNPLRELSSFAGLQFISSSSEASGGLFSPRQSMFSRNMFHPFGRPAQIADPRSPPTKGEAPIIRSIDDLL